MDEDEVVRDLLENAPVLIQSVATDGRLLYVNRTWRQTLGYEAAEVSKLTLGDVIDECSREHCGQLFERVIGGEELDHVEAVFRARDGRRVEVEGSVGVRRMAGEVIASRGVFRDVTAERRLAAERDRFFRMSRDMLCVAGADGYFKRLNPAWTRTLGWPIGELLSRPLIDFVHPEDRHATQVEIGHLGVPHEAIEFQNRYRCRDGSYRWLQWNSVADPTQGLIYAVARDVTEENRQADELVAARAVAAKASAAKSEFLAGMSHELRTPLNSLLGFASILLRDVADRLRPEERLYIERIRDNGAHLLELINAVLDLSKVEAGKLEVDLCEVDVAELVTDTVAGLQAQAERKGIDLAVEVPVAKPAVRLQTDPRLLKQILINLVAHAIQFTDRGGVGVRVVPAAPAAIAGAAAIEIIDTGAGVDPERLPRRFEGFGQGDAGTDRSHDGTGLGLVLSREIARALGHTIEVESSPGLGSTFRVFLETL